MSSHMANVVEAEGLVREPSHRGVEDLGESAGHLEAQDNDAALIAGMFTREKRWKINRVQRLSLTMRKICSSFNAYTARSIINGDHVRAAAS